MQKPVGDITRQTDEGSRSKAGRWKDRKAEGQKDWLTDGHALWPFKCPFSYQQRMPAEHLQCRKRRTKRAKGSRGEQVKMGETRGGAREGNRRSCLAGNVAKMCTWNCQSKYVKHRRRRRRRRRLSFVLSSCSKFFYLLCFPALFALILNMCVHV